MSDENSIKQIACADMFRSRLKKLVSKKLIEADRNGEKTTYQKIADELGVTRQTLNDYINDRKKGKTPDTSFLISLAHYFNVSVDYLLGLSDHIDPDPRLQEMSKRTGLSDKGIRALELLYKPATADESIYKTDLEKRHSIMLINEILEDQFERLNHYYEEKEDIPFGKNEELLPQESVFSIMWTYIHERYIFVDETNDGQYKPSTPKTIQSTSGKRYLTSRTMEELYILNALKKLERCLSIYRDKYIKVSENEKYSEYLYNNVLNYGYLNIPQESKVRLKDALNNGSIEYLDCSLSSIIKDKNKDQD